MKLKINPRRPTHIQCLCSFPVHVHVLNKYHTYSSEFPPGLGVPLAVVVGGGVRVTDWPLCCALEHSSLGASATGFQGRYPGRRRKKAARSCQLSFPLDLLSHLSNCPTCTLTEPQRRVPPPGLLAHHHPAPPSLSLRPQVPGSSVQAPVASQVGNAQVSTLTPRDFHGEVLASEHGSPHLGPVTR